MEIQSRQAQDASAPGEAKDTSVEEGRGGEGEGREPAVAETITKRRDSSSGPVK